MTLPTCFPVLGAEVMAVVWLKMKCGVTLAVTESENWVIDGKMPGDQRNGHNIFQLSQTVLFLLR